MRVKMLVTNLATLLAASMIAVPASGAPPVTSLRGMHDIDAPAQIPELKRYQKDGEPFERAYVDQPPLIPHRIDGYQIDLKFNKCLSCHSWKHYKKYGATKISRTHFIDRNGKELANVAPRRYFCTQCHVPQANAKPLVENTFTPVEALGGQ